MREASKATQFPFIQYDGPSLPQDPSVRGIIRQRAMRDVAITRKRRGNNRQCNRRQYPIFLGPDHESDESVSPEEPSPLQLALCSPIQTQPTTFVENSKQHNSLYPYVDIPQSLRSSGELALSASSFQLLNLAPLTGLRLGIAGLTSLDPASEHGANLLSTPNPCSGRLLSFIPSRYGQSASLSYATDCIIAKLQQMMIPPGSRHANGDAIILHHYTNALQTLQVELSNDALIMKPETLCTTELLAVFELLNSTTESKSWLRHAGGAARLIQIRGPDRFSTEFELALFMAHVGPIVTDAMLSNNTCFLAEAPWLEVLHRAIYDDDTLTSNRYLILQLWTELVNGPGMYKRTTELTLSSTPPAQAAIDDLIDRLIRDREGLFGWLQHAQQQEASLDGWDDSDDSVFPQPSFGKGFSHSLVMQLMLRGTYTMCRMLKARMLYTLAPRRFGHLEIKCQDLAERILGLTALASADEGGRMVGSFFMSQSTWIAKGIMETREIWSPAGCEQRDGPIEKWKFRAWCRAVGRKC